MSFDKNDKDKILFYNVENLFDTQHDKGTTDRDYLPEGDKHWSWERYRKKLSDVAETITWNGEKLPFLIGLCEVENDNVLTDLLSSPEFKDQYKFVHLNGKDRRGIDVALLYRESIFELDGFKNMEIEFPWNKNILTRDILYVQGYIRNQKIHVFVNHWPSRSKGVEDSNSERMVAAWRLRQEVERIRTHDPNAKFIIMGDFNDTPNDSSLTDVLKAQGLTEGSEMINLCMIPFKEGKGTHTYEGKWELLDQIIVSSNMTAGEGLLINPDQPVCHIMASNNLLTKDSEGNVIPFGTYDDDRYLGGYSDHLPIYIDVIFK